MGFAVQSFVRSFVQRTERSGNIVKKCVFFTSQYQQILTRARVLLTNQYVVVAVQAILFNAMHVHWILAAICVLLTCFLFLYFILRILKLRERKKKNFLIVLNIFFHSDLRFQRNTACQLLKILRISCRCVYFFSRSTL